MLSDVPVGILLSGGVDSAAIAALAAEQNGKTPCISVGFGNDFPECELADAADTAQLLGLPLHPVLVNQDQLWETFEDCISSIEEPLGTSSVLPMWHLCQRARELVTVVLTGQGSDEPWGGYRRYQAELWRDIPCMPVLAKSMARILPHLPEHLERALGGIPIPDRATRFEKEYCLFTPSQRQMLTGRADHGAAVATIGYWLDATSGAVAVRGAEAMMKVDSRMGLADDLLLYGDKVSMAHSLEARVPMLDLELVRFIESLPLHYRVSLKCGKIVHKHAAEKYLPASIVHRRKRAFGVPFAAWIRSCWRERAADVLFDPSGLHLNWLRQEGIRYLWDAHQSGRRNYSRQIFALLAFAFWCRTMTGCLEGKGSHRQPILMKAYDAYLV